MIAKKQEVTELRLTPLDIKKQEFKKVMRGYDPVEVDTILEMIAEELEDAIRDKNALADEALKLKTQLKDYQSVEKTLQDTLVSAQASIQESKDNSSREAEILMKEAEIRAEKILEDTKLKLAEMKNDLILLKSQKDSFARRLKHLLESQIQLIDVLEMDDMGFAQYENTAARNQRPAMKQHSPASSSRPAPRTESTEKEREQSEPIPQNENNPAATTLESDEPLGMNWGKRATPNPDIDKTDKQDSSNRISDKFIA